MVATLQVHPGVWVVVAGVYVPPSQSQFLSVPYSKVMDNLAETISTLALQHSVPREGILLVGAFNAHVYALDSGCPDLAGLTTSVGAAPLGWYPMTRFLSCQGCISLPSGEAFSHGYHCHGWLLLNTRSPSNLMGCPTCSHCGVCTVLDFLVIPDMACAHVWVLPPP